MARDFSKSCDAEFPKLPQEVHCTTKKQEKKKEEVGARDINVTQLLSSGKENSEKECHWQALVETKGQSAYVGSEARLRAAWRWDI